ncbi:hypothetical protein ACI7RC_10315 [Brevibacillus sp. B_LB10_24]|uniref:hypothetical protein n=1 Tax=Brevibacillus sp. B_LB10_24 TaxID=3380645 RepID=UPI0038B7022F
MVKKYTCIRVAQDAETPVRRSTGVFTYRFAYARAADTKTAGDKGQDYVTFGRREGSFIFAICDGVSLSFYGELAARFLGDALLDWLSSAAVDRASEQEKLRQSLQAYLSSLTGPASSIIDKYPIPKDVTGILRDVLEEKRKLGSETTFVCGRIDLPGRVHKNGKIVLAWQGDSRLRLWQQALEKTSLLGEAFFTAHRWSTLRGPVGGGPHVAISELSQSWRITRLLVYTDGLADLDGWRGIPDDRQLQQLIDDAGRKATSDDIAVLDVSWRLPADGHRAGEPPVLPGFLADCVAKIKQFLRRA